MIHLGRQCHVTKAPPHPHHHHPTIGQEFLSGRRSLQHYVFHHRRRRMMMRRLTSSTTTTTIPPTSSTSTNNSASSWLGGTLPSQLIQFRFAIIFGWPRSATTQLGSGRSRCPVSRMITGSSSFSRGLNGRCHAECIIILQFLLLLCLLLVKSPT